MAKTDIFGPTRIDLGQSPLAPMKFVDWWWGPWETEFYGGVFTFNAYPSTVQPDGGSRLAKMWVAATSIELQPGGKGDISYDVLWVSARFFNSGPSAVRFFSVYISVVRN